MTGNVSNLGLSVVGTVCLSLLAACGEPKPSIADALNAKEDEQLAKIGYKPNPKPRPDGLPPPTDAASSAMTFPSKRLSRKEDRPSPGPAQGRRMRTAAAPAVIPPDRRRVRPDR